MPYATNPKDGLRVYFEDWGGDRPPVLVYPGFTDPVAYAQRSALVQGLRDEFRLIFGDHRGQGRSDKPHDVESYALTTRVLDAAAILDALAIDRAHFLGFSWGARFGFAMGEHAPERVRSMALCGNQPYAWPTGGPMMRSVVAAIAAGRERGMEAFVDTWEAAIGEEFPEPGRSWMLENDPVALDAAFGSALEEGRISQDLSRWRIPCLIYAGKDDEMHDLAARSAQEIPTATFLSLAGHTHFSAERVGEELLPRVQELFRNAR